MMGNKGSIHTHVVPKLEEEHLIQDEVNLIIQVNGKVRGTIKISKEISENKEKVQEESLKNPNVIKFLGNMPTKKVIFVPGKLINLVS